MAQNPLPPPPPSGGVLDGWLYLLWRRLTQTGQILWESITPGTSADVAAAVTDETGSPGSLVFSGNPTLTGLTVSGAAFTSRGITDNATSTALTIDSNRRLSIGATPLTNVPLTIYDATSATLSLDGDSSVIHRITRYSSDGTSAILNMRKARGTFASPAAVSSGDNVFGLGTVAYDGSSYIQIASFVGLVETYTAATDVSGAVLLAVRPTGAGATSVEKFRLASNGTITLGGPSTAPALKVTPVASQARWIEVTGATSGGNPTLGVSGGILAISASTAITGTVSTSGYTVATLPAGTVGDRAYVTDALAPAYGVAVAGGGAVTIPVFYNGAAWICA